MTQTLTHSPGQHPTFMPTIRVSVIAPLVQVDVDLAYTVPLYEVVPALVGMINAVLESQSKPLITSSTQPHDWTLCTIGSPLFSLHDSLKNAGVKNGDVLLLQSVHHHQSPAMFDDLVDAVVQVRKANHSFWDSHAALSMSCVATMLMTITLSLVLMRVCLPSHFINSAISLGAAGIIIIAAIIQGKIFHRQIAASLFLLCAYPLLFSGMSVLPDFPLHALGFVCGCASVAIAALIFPYICPSIIAAHCAVLIMSVIGVIGGIVGIFWQVSNYQIAALCIGIGLLGLGIAPQLALLVYKLPLPYVCAAGESLSSVQQQAQYTTEKLDGLGSIVVPSETSNITSQRLSLQQKILAAHDYLTGVLSGTSCALSLACIFTLWTLPANDARALALAIIVPSALALLGRTLTDKLQAAITIGCAVVCITCSLGILIYHDNGGQLYLCIAFLCLAIIVACLSGTVGIHVNASPLTQRAIELVGYFLFASIVPLIFWIADIYSLIRHR